MHVHACTPQVSHTRFCVEAVEPLHDLAITVGVLHASVEVHSDLWVPHHLVCHSSTCAQLVTAHEQVHLQGRVVPVAQACARQLKQGLT